MILSHQQGVNRWMGCLIPTLFPQHGRLLDLPYLIILSEKLCHQMYEEMGLCQSRQESTGPILAEDKNICHDSAASTRQNRRASSNSTPSAGFLKITSLKYSKEEFLQRCSDSHCV